MLMNLETHFARRRVNRWPCHDAVGLGNNIYIYIYMQKQKLMFGRGHWQKTHEAARCSQTYRFYQIHDASRDQEVFQAFICSVERPFAFAMPSMENVRIG